MPRVSVVTGGTRGIGEHISIGLKEVGYKVAATYGANDDAAKKFNEATGIPTYKFDASDYEACKENIAKIEADLGPVEILINNAGITRDAPFHRMTYEQWHQ
jgi:acetoacetyl-CoA reductase